VGNRNNSNIIRHVKYGEHFDDFPTPPWATRAFFEYVAPHLDGGGLLFLEPAAGRGHMVRTITERGFQCSGYDARDYGAEYEVADYTDPMTNYPAHDVMLTNPPYKFAQTFVERGLREARVGVGVLARTLWAESAVRYRAIFRDRPPFVIAIFEGRVPAETGGLRRSGAMMSHSWFWWDKRFPRGVTRFAWIPPEAQELLEKDEDYA